MEMNEFSYRSRSRDEVVAHFNETAYASGVAAMLGEQQTVVAANSAFARMMGTGSPEELVGLSTDVFYPDSQPDGRTSDDYRKQLRKRYRENGFLRYTIIVKSLDDRPILMEVTSHVVEYAGGRFDHHTYSKLQDPDDVSFGDRSTEAVYRDIIEKSRESTALLVGGTVVVASPSMKKLFGFPQDTEVIEYEAGMFSPEFQPSGVKSSEAITDFFKQAIKGGDHMAPWLIKDGDGVERMIDVHITSLVLGGQQTFHVTFHDYVGETMARKSAEKMLAALDATTDGLMLIDMSDTSIVECNRVAHEMLGYSKRELLAMRVPDLVPKEYFESNSEHLLALKQGEYLPPFESAHVAKSGEVVPVVISVKTIEVEGQKLALGSVRDRREELKLRKAADDLRDQFESVGKLLPVGVFIHVAEEGHIYVNDSWCEITGLSREEGLGYGWKKVLPEDEREQIMQKGQDELTNTGVGSGRYQLKRPDGTRAWVAYRSVMLQLSDGSVTVLGTIQDVTEEARHQQELEVARKTAVEASEAKSLFLSKMSHELRTPLNAVLGFTQVLQSDSLTPDQKEALGHIEQGGLLLLRHIEDLLSLAQIERGKIVLDLQDHNIVILVKPVVSMLQYISANAGVKIITDDLDQGVVARVDERRFQQVLINMLSTAIKYNHEGGSTEVRVDQVSGNARVQIIDTGRGIPADKLEKLFVPFERLGAEFTRVEGLGIGLALANELTQLMGGKLEAESQEGHGTTMTVLIPIS